MLSRLSALCLLRSCVVFFSLSSANSADTSCSFSLEPPIEIPIRNITVSGQLMRRGATLSVGSPPQKLGFDASANLVQTYVFDSPAIACNTSAPSFCSAHLGGFFHENLSTSWSQAVNLESLHTKTPEFHHENDLFGTDTMHINSTLSLQNYPLRINQGLTLRGEEINTLGLGRNSTFLNALSTAGFIASNTWSYFQGWTGSDPQHQIDGSLVLGGYDADKIKIGGNNLTIPFTDDPNCVGGLVVTITDIRMNLRNGSNPTILGPSAGLALKACIDPSYSLVATLWVDIWNQFVDISKVQAIGVEQRSRGIYFWAMLISAEGAYDGDLTFTLSSTLDIRIPNHQLVLPDYPGQNMSFNPSNRVVLINSLQSSTLNDMPTLGRSFFSSAHLLVNNELERFTISQSNVTETKSLIAIGPQSCSNSPPHVTPSSALGSPNTPATTRPLSSGSSSTVSSVPPASPGGTLSKRVIAGTAIGVVSFCLLLIAGIFLLRKPLVLARAFGQTEGNARHHTREAPDTGVHTTNPLYLKAELPSDRQPPQEMPIVQNPQGYVPSELPSDRQPPQEMPIVQDPPGYVPSELPATESDR